MSDRPGERERASVLPCRGGERRTARHPEMLQPCPGRGKEMQWVWAPGCDQWDDVQAVSSPSGENLTLTECYMPEDMS